MKFLKVCSISYLSWASWAGPFLKNAELGWAVLDLIWKILIWAELISTAQLAQQAQVTKFTTLDRVFFRRRFCPNTFRGRFLCCGWISRRLLFRAICTRRRILARRGRAGSFFRSAGRNSGAWTESLACNRQDSFRRSWCRTTNCKLLSKQFHLDQEL